MKYSLYIFIVFKKEKSLHEEEFPLFQECTVEELCHHKTLAKDASVWCMVLCKCVFTDPVRTPEPGVHSDISKIKALV